MRACRPAVALLWLWLERNQSRLRECSGMSLDAFWGVSTRLQTVRRFES
jgi:hypothetical protein